MSAYLVVQANIKDKSLYEEFISKILPLYKNYNAKILAADNDPKLLEGDQQYKRTVIIEFENNNALRAWTESLQYKELSELRRTAADSNITYVHGVNHI